MLLGLATEFLELAANTLADLAHSRAGADGNVLDQPAGAPAQRCSGASHTPVCQVSNSPRIQSSFRFNPCEGGSRASPVSTFLKKPHVGVGQVIGAIGDDVAQRKPTPHADAGGDFQITLRWVASFVPNRAGMKLVYLLEIYLRRFGQVCKIFRPIAKLQARSDSTDGPKCWGRRQPNRDDHRPCSNKPSVHRLTGCRPSVLG